MEILLVTFIGLFVWVLFNAALYVFSSAILGENKEKFKKTVRLPIPKRFKTKVNPIYEIKRDSFGGDYYIFKYSLRYSRNNLYDMFCFFLIPYPITFETYGYNLEGECGLGDDVEVCVLEDSLEEFYEKQDKIEKQKKQKENEEKNKLQNKLHVLNKTFKENYE